MRIFRLLLSAFLALSSPAALAEWRLVETYRDLAIFYETNSVKRFRDEILFSTLTNYFVKKGEGEEEYKSMTVERSINCIKETITIYSLVQYSEHFAGGREVFAGAPNIEPSSIDRNTVAEDLMKVVCKLTV